MLYACDPVTFSTTLIAPDLAIQCFAEGFDNGASLVKENLEMYLGIVLVSSATTKADRARDQDQYNHLPCRGWSGTRAGDSKWWSGKLYRLTLRHTIFPS